MHPQQGFITWVKHYRPLPVVHSNRELRPLPTGKRGSREPNRHLHDRTDFKMKKKMLFVLIWQLLPSISNLCHAQFALISNWGCPPSHSCTMYSVPTALQLRSLLLHCLNFFAGLGQGKA
eukprot:scaffold29194_cov17-Tisochrysis_lutea.AAC.1